MPDFFMYGIFLSTGLSIIQKNEHGAKAPCSNFNFRYLIGGIVKQVVAQIPKLFGKVNIIFVGIFEALYLVPKGIHLLCAVFFDFLEGLS